MVSSDCRVTCPPHIAHMGPLFCLLQHLLCFLIVYNHLMSWIIDYLMGMDIEMVTSTSNTLEFTWTIKYWTDHTAATYKKGQRRLHLLRKLGSSWGLSMTLLWHQSFSMEYIGAILFMFYYYYCLLLYWIVLWVLWGTHFPICRTNYGISDSDSYH